MLGPRWRVVQSFARPQGPLLAARRSASSRPKAPTRSSNRLVAIGAVSLVGTGLVIFTDSGSTLYGTSVRTGRVAYTLYRNIYDYRRTMAKKADREPEEYDKQLKACHKRCAERTLHAMEMNGSIFIKLGQHLTSLNYLLPSEWCDTFIPLQDQCPVTSFDAVKKMVETDIGMPFDDVFSDFEHTPLGAASLAQVHRATDKRSGEKVAVKVQHPVLDHWAPLDMSLTTFTFKTLKRFFPEYDLTWLSEEMTVSLPQELNFTLEGENATKAREYFAKIPSIPLVIPRVLWSARRILVMEFMAGHRPDDLAFLDANHISRDEVSATLARIFNTMIFARGAPLHCDPHGGNIAVRPNTSRRGRHNFDIILYDHGLYRTIPLTLQRNYAKLWLAVLDADEPAMRRYARETAGITDAQFPLFASAITGRDFRVVTSDVSGTPRSAAEKQAIGEALEEGMLQQLVALLGQVPRIILLILKTNDLTRALDTNLQTHHGPMRSFLILARHAAQTVYDEQLEALHASSAALWPARALWAWAAFVRVRLRLALYEWYLYARGRVGLANALPVPAAAAGGAAA